MRSIASLFLTATIVVSLSACQLIYKLPTRQGNVIDQKDLDRLELGMTREQVQFLLGTPISENPFRKDRWDYIGYYRSPRGTVAKRTVTLYFSENSLSAMEGINRNQGVASMQAPNAKDVDEQKKRDELAEERQESEQQSGGGVTITSEVIE